MILGGMKSPQKNKIVAWVLRTNSTAGWFYKKVALHHPPLAFCSRSGHKTVLTIPIFDNYLRLS